MREAKKAGTIRASPSQPNLRASGLTDKESMSIAFRRPKAVPYSAPGSAVFLHTSWRTAGTWIWHQFRANPATMAFYEPLHEELCAVSLDRITETNTESWESGHPETAPYFLEFAALVSRLRKGVAGFNRRFAFDNFFMREDDADERLHEYVMRLHNLAFASGRRPVFKFVRALGRAGWLRRTFPNATHVGIIRDPIVQWESSHRLAQRGVPYFLAMPAALLAANREEPIVKATAAMLDVQLSHLRGHDLHGSVKRAEAFVAHASTEETYRLLLCYWLVTSIAALEHMDLIVDSDELGSSGEYRASVQRQLQQHTGIAVNFENPRVPRRGEPMLDPRRLERLHAQAVKTAESFGAPAIVGSKLGSAQQHYVSLQS